MSFVDLFIGSTQSKYASIAIISAIVVICLAILFTNTEISIGNRLVTVMFIMLLSVFPVALSLFELTCIVNSDTKNNYGVCGYYGWVIAAMISVYCIVIIISTFISMFTYKKALDNVKIEETFNTVVPQDAQTIAANIMKEDREEKKDSQVVPMSASQPVSEPVSEPVGEPVSQPVKVPQMFGGDQLAPQLDGEIAGFSTTEYSPI